MSAVSLRASWTRPAWRELGLRLAFAAFLLLSLCPILLTDIPALVDYPNHLARMSILARAGTASAQPYYGVVWAPYPNLAMDLIVPPLARLIGVEAATKWFYVAGQLLIVSGAMALSFAVRRRCLGAGLVASMSLYSVPFAWGFANFEFALGASLWAIALWVATGPGTIVDAGGALPSAVIPGRPEGANPDPMDIRPRGNAASPQAGGFRLLAFGEPRSDGRSGARREALRLAVHTLAVFALAAGHLFALGIYGFTIGLIELARARSERHGWARLAGTFGAMAAPVVVMAVAMTSLGGGVGGARTEWGFAYKLTWLFAMNGFSGPLSMALSAPLMILGYAAIRSGAIRFIGAGPGIAAGLAILFLAMPFRLFDTAFVDVRVVVAAALILPAFLAAGSATPAFRATALAIVGTAALANLGYTIAFQAGYRADYGAMRASFGHLERGATILVASRGDEADPPADLTEYPMNHAPALAVHMVDAFLPTLFTYPGKQPIVPKASVERLALREGGPVPMALLRAIAEGRLSDPALAHVASWTRDFGYLYVLGAPSPNPMPAALAPLVESARFSLYRIRPGGRASTAP